MMRDPRERDYQPLFGVNAQPKSRIICVGTGRDGTLSIYQMIQGLFDSTDGRRVMHEYCSREFYQAFSEYYETEDESYADDIRRMIDECPYDCIVGNGYAAILPLFRERWGADTKLIHIRRSDRNACIDSLLTNAELFPFAYGYYASAESAAIKRMAAFHFDEMSKEAWDRLPADAKFGWYYDKTHALIELHKSLFAGCTDLITEALNDENTRRALALAVVSDAIVPPATHLNAHSFNITSVADDQRDRAMWLLGRLNWHRLLNDDVHGIEYFLDKFLAWTGYQVRGERNALGRARRPSREESADTIARAKSILVKTLENIAGLEKLNRNRDD